MKLKGVMKNNNEDLIDRIVYLMERDDARDAPAESVKWAKNLFRARAAEPKKSLADRVRAVLTLDLAPNKAVFGERSSGGATQQARQMLFAAGAASVDLRVAKTKKGRAVRGQILGAGFAGAEITLASEKSHYNVRADEMSEFFFPEIAVGTYEATIKGETGEIIIERIEIG